MFNWMPKNPYLSRGLVKSYQYISFSRGCKETAYSILNWLNQPCPHSEPLTLTTRRECDKCMEEFQNEVMRPG